MSNATGNIPIGGIGQDGRRFHVAVKGSTTIYEGVAVAQMVATGCLVPASTAGAGPAIGKAIAKADNSGGSDGDKRCEVETDRIFTFANGTSSDACSEATPIGSHVWAGDDHTACATSNSGARQKLGTFQGMEADGKVRVRMTPEDGRGASFIQQGRGTFAAGVLAVSAGITVTANSRFFFSRVTAAGTSGDEIRVPDADRTVGGPGTGAFTARSYLSAVAATSDTSTFDWMIVG